MLDDFDKEFSLFAILISSNIAKIYLFIEPLGMVAHQEYLGVLCQRAYENNHFHTKISIQISNELVFKIRRKIGENLIFRSRHTEFSVEP